MAEEVNFEQLGPAVGQRFPALTFGTTGGTQIDLEYEPTTPLKSSVANTNTT